MFDSFIQKSASNFGISIPGNDYVITEEDDTELKKSKAWDLFDNALKGLETVPKDGDYAAFVRSYVSIVWVYVCTWIIQTSIASVPLRLLTGDRRTPDEVDMDDPCYDLLLNPNPEQSGEELIEEAAMYLELAGINYFEKVFDKTGLLRKTSLPLKLFNLQPQFVEVKSDPIEKVSAYKYDIEGSGNYHWFKPREICPVRYQNPTSIYYGQGSVRALQATLITEIYRETYNKSFFENEARPDVILTHDADITKGIMPLQPDTLRQIAIRWHKAFGGPKKTRLPVVLQSGMHVDTLSETPKDMDFREMEKSLRERILASFGVPPALAGLYESVNYASSKEQIKVFWSAIIPPKLKTISNALNRGIVKPHNNKYWCEFDDSVIKALEESPKEHEERLSRSLERGGITLGEYRTGLGYKVKANDPFKDKRLISANLIDLETFFAALPDEGGQNGGMGTGAEGSQSGERQTQQSNVSE
jgi:HK97 family phage portal protein